MVRGRLLTFLAVVVSFLLFATGALAAGKTIAVVVEGNNASEVRRQVLEVVPKTLEVVSPDTFGAALSKAGQKGPFGNGIALAKGRDRQLTAIRKALEASKADAAVIGRVRKARGGADEVYIVLVDAIPGDLAVDEAVPLKGSEADRIEAIRKVLGPPLAAMAPAPVAEAKPEENKPDAADKPKDDADKDEPAKVGDWKSGHVGTALFVVGASFELGGRKFKYTDRITPNLRDYDVFGAPGFALDAEVYPAATTKIAVLSDIGLTVAYGQIFGVSSSTGDSAYNFDNTWNHFSTGIRYRLRIGDGADVPTVGVSGRFGFVTFSFDPQDKKSEEIGGEVASVKYTFLRPGLDARIPAGPVAFMAGFGWMFILDGGDVVTRFTPDNRGTKGDASLGGLDLSLGLAVGIAGGLEARLVAQYDRFFYAFEPQVGDQYVAGGALDQVLGLRLGAAYAF